MNKQGTGSLPLSMIPYSLVSHATNPRARIILFHGLTSHPYDFLHIYHDPIAKDFSVIAPCLSGHGTSLEDLSHTSLAAWYDDAERVIAAHHNYPGPLFVGGSSLGSFIAIMVARKLPVKGLILMAPPTQLRVWYHEPLLKLFSLLPDELISKLGSRPKEPVVTEPRITYTARSIGASVRLLELRAHALEVLRTLSLPILVLHDPFDALVVAEAPDHITEIATESHVDSISLPYGLHELNVGPARAELRMAIRGFVEEHVHR